MSEGRVYSSCASSGLRQTWCLVQRVGNKCRTVPAGVYTCVCASGMRQVNSRCVETRGKGAARGTCCYQGEGQWLRGQRSKEAEVDLHVIAGTSWLHQRQMQSPRMLCLQRRHLRGNKHTHLDEM